MLDKRKHHTTCMRKFNDIQIDLFSYSLLRQMVANQMVANNTHTHNRTKHTTSCEMLHTELGNELYLNNKRDKILKLLQITVNGSFKSLPHSRLHCRPRSSQQIRVNIQLTCQRIHVILTSGIWLRANAQSDYQTPSTSSKTVTYLTI